MARIELRYSRRLAPARDRKLLQVRVSRRGAQVLQALVAREPLALGRRYLALERKGLVHFLDGRGYKLTPKGREYVWLRWPWLIKVGKGG